jgi:hypothetical protein
MDYKHAFELVKELEYDKECTVYSEKDIIVFITRPSKLSRKFSDYDSSKNFQIWLQSGSEKFRPNHLRILIDVNLRSKSRPDLKEELLKAFDSIYYGEDPLHTLQNLQNETFRFYLNDIMTIGILHQLLLIEQAYAYHGESHFDPPNLFLQGWIREFIDGPKELDNMCMSVAHGQPPLARYVSMENKKDKKYVNNLGELWYLQ